MISSTIILMLLCLLTGTINAQVSHVVPPGIVGHTPVSPYGTWGTAATNIQTAIDAAVGQGWSNVWVTNGTYYLEQQINIQNPMILRSWNDGELDREGTIVDGNYPAKEIRCFYLNHPEAAVRGFTVRNAFNSNTGINGRGGGILLTNNATVDNCLIISNYANAGGGIYMYGGLLANSLILTNTTSGVGGGGGITDGGMAVSSEFKSNYSPSGGGIYISSEGVVSNCVVTANSATIGGGTYLTNSLITHSRVMSNTATAFGGGLYLLYDAVARSCLIDANVCTYTTRSSNRGGGGLSVWANALVEDCTISNNVAYGCGGGGRVMGGTIRRCLITDNDSGTAGEENSNGGGVFISGNALVDSCQILRNRASKAYGGGIITWDIGVTLRNCLIAENIAVTGSGGIYAYRTILEIDNCTITSNHVENSTSTTAAGGFFSGYTNHCRNTIIYGNTIAGSSTCSNIYLDGSATISTFTNTCVAPLQTGVKVINDNSFAVDPLLADNYQLLPNSPCINAGIYQAWMDDAKDITGRSRVDKFSGIPDVGCFEHTPAGFMFRLR